MTPAQIRTSVEKGRLQLTHWQRFNHYGAAIFTLFVPLCLATIILYDWLSDGRLDSELSIEEVILFSAPWAILSLVLFRHLFRILSLNRVYTPLEVSEIRQLLANLARREGWTVQNNRKTFMVMKTHPRMSWNWGEKITVLFYKDEVWVNSICDPDYESAVYSSGRNNRNRRRIYEMLSGNRRLSDQ